MSDRLITSTAAMEREENPRYLAISMGPQEGKSTLVAFAFPVWLWLRNPDLRIMVISYDDETAVRWGRAIKEALAQHAGDDPLHGVRLHLDLRAGSEAVARLQLDGYLGSLTCVSLTGGISGKPADVIVLDDVVKDRRTARSAAFKKLWRAQWQTAITARLAPKSLVVMDHTRWAEDDPIGQQLAENGARWEYLNIPAVVETRADPNTPQLGTPNKVRAADPLGRVEGEWMVSARGRTVAQWEKRRVDVGEPDFWALYQGQPYAAAGGLFKRRFFRYWEATGDRWRVRIPGREGPDEDVRIAFRFLTVDLAASTRTSADWTVAAAWAVAGVGQLLLLDVARGQVSPEQHWDVVVAPLARRWMCPIYVEGSQYGTDLVYSAAREGHVIHAVHPDADKYTRAVPAARRLGQGMILFPPSGHWVPDWEDELLAFPQGQHDDQVDVLSYAHRVVGEFWVPPPADYGPGPAAADVAAAFGREPATDLRSVAL
jgi:predicted phage terminase large subunit-like protein